MLSMFRRKAAPTSGPDALPSDSAPDQQGSPSAGAASPRAQLSDRPATASGGLLTRFEAHPLADMLPLITGREFDELVESVKRDGLLEQIVMAGEKILDGRNRYRACIAAGIELTTEHFKSFDSDDEAAMAAFVTSKNVNRRHLSEAQRAMVAAQLMTHHSVAMAQASEQLNVSPATIRRARFVLASGDTNVVRLVRQGDLSVHAAYEQAKKRPTKATVDTKLARTFDAIERALASGEEIGTEMRQRAGAVASMLLALRSTDAAA